MYTQSYMLSVRGTLRGLSVLSKTQRNRAVLFRTRFTTICVSKIHNSLNVDADALNRLRRRFLLRCTIHYIRQGQ
jgi:hypothetical protein